MELTPKIKANMENEQHAPEGILLTDDQAGGHIKKRRGRKAWITIAVLLAIGALAAAAYFLFFHKSPEVRAAEADQTQYEELVDDCRKAIRRADSFADLEAVQEKMEDVEDLEIKHSRTLPDIYCQYDNLEERYDKMAQKLRQQVIDEAEQYIDDNDYRAAYDTYQQAASSLPDDSDLERRRNRMARQMGYIYVTDIQFANCERDGTDIEAAGTRLHSDRMRYLYPKVIYNSLLPSGHSNIELNLKYKVYSPDGRLDCSSNSPAGYTNKGSFWVAVGERNQGEWLNGWGNATTSTYGPGDYSFELYYEGHKIYECEFTIY